jgi:hypothetical protein
MVLQKRECKTRMAKHGIESVYKNTLNFITISQNFAINLSGFEFRNYQSIAKLLCFAIFFAEFFRKNSCLGMS